MQSIYHMSNVTRNWLNVNTAKQEQRLEIVRDINVLEHLTDPLRGVKEETF